MGLKKDNLIVNDGKGKCGSNRCSLVVDKESIRCDGCAKWYHYRCSKLAKAAIVLYTVEKDLVWVCRACLDKLHADKLNEGIQELSIDSPQAELLPSNDASNDSAETIPTVGVCDTIKENEEATAGVRSPECVAKRSRVSGSKKAKSIVRHRKKMTSNVIGEFGAPGSPGKGIKLLNILEGALLGICERVDAHTRKIEEISSKGDDLAKRVADLRVKGDLALGRNRNVVIKGIPEPFMKESKARDRAMRYHIVNLLRQANIPEHVAIKRVLRLGKFRGIENNDPQVQRPVLVEFANPRHRDHFLATAERISALSQGRVSVSPDDSAGWRNSSNGYKGRTLSEFIHTKNDVSPPNVLLTRLTMEKAGFPANSASPIVRVDNKENEPKDESAGGRKDSVNKSNWVKVVSKEARKKLIPAKNGVKAQAQRLGEEITNLELVNRRRGVIGKRQ